MAVTRNDWDIIDSGSSDRLENLRWITGKVRAGDAHTILDDLGEKFNKQVEPIIKAHSWGYAKRDVRGNAGIPSEHSSGTAVDFNAPAHPIGKKNTFSIFKRAKIRKLVKSYDGSVRWGGEWSRPDDMHFELVGGAAKLKQVASKLSGGSVAPSGSVKPPVTQKPTKKPPESKQWPYKALPLTSAHTTDSHNAWVKLMADIGHKDKGLGTALQKWLKAAGYYRGLIDGNFSSMSVKGLQLFLKAKGFYKGAIDGNRGAMAVKAEISYLNSQMKFY